MKEIRITPSPQEPTFREFRQHPERYPEQWQKLHRVLQDLIPRLLHVLRVLSEAFRPGTVPGDIGLIVSGEDRSEALLRLARRLPWTSARIRKALARRVEERKKRDEEASLEDEEVRERAAALLLVLTMDKKEMKRLRIPDEMTWSEFLRWAVLKEMERSAVERSEAGDHEVDLEGLPDPAEQKELEEVEAGLELESCLQELWASLTLAEQQLLQEIVRQLKESGEFNLTRAAQSLGLSPNTGWTLWHRIRRKARREGLG